MVLENRQNHKGSVKLMGNGKRKKTMGVLLATTLLLPVIPMAANAKPVSENHQTTEVYHDGITEIHLGNDYKTGKLMIHDQRVSITLDAGADIKNGVVFTGDYAGFHGEGFADTTVTIKPKNDGAIVDFNGTSIPKVTIVRDRVSEIRGNENIQQIEYVKGATPETITFLDSEFSLSIMHTNDTHAHLDNVAKRVTAVKQVRAEKTNTLLLDAGDVFSGTLYFNEFQGMASLEFMNLMDYDAMTFGNHEFDLGSSAEGHQGLADFVEAANFPFVSTNVDFSTDETFTGLFSDRISSDQENGKIYNGIVKEIDGEKVGIFGLTTEDTVDLSSPGAIDFEDYITEAEKAVKAFESQGVDKIIALTHIGFDDNPAVDNDLILAAEVAGIDVIVGGHTHTKLDEPVVVNEDENGRVKDPTVVVQAYQYNNFLGSVDVEFNQKGVVVGHDGELISIADQVADPEATEVLMKYKSVVEKVSQDPTGATTVHALLNPRLSDEGNDGTSVRNSETPLGNVITDGMLAKARKYNDDVVMAMQNGGGIRAGIDEGPITVGEVITVLPFGNTLATMTLSGAELKEAFEHSLRSYPQENGGFLHVSGAKVKFDSSKPAGDRVVSISYREGSGNYVEIQDDQIYPVATNAFTAKGGDGYDVFAKAYEEGRVTDLGLSDWENFAEHLANLGTVDPEVEGRIVDVAE